MSETTEVRYPGCTVQLTGKDGNVFLIIGRVRVALRQHLKEIGVATAETNRRLDEFVTEVQSSESYDEALRVIMRWVDVE